MSIQTPVNEDSQKHYAQKPQTRSKPVVNQLTGKLVTQLDTTHPQKEISTDTHNNMDTSKINNKAKYKILCGRNLIECCMYYRILFSCKFLVKAKLETDREKSLRVLS